MKRAISIAGVILLAAAFGLSALAVANSKTTLSNSKSGSAESQKGGLPALEDRVDKLEGEVALLNSEVAALQTAVAALQSAVSALQSAVSALQSAVSTLQSTVATLVTAVTDLQGQNNWAVVNSSGHVVRHSGTSAVTAAKQGTGVYEVTFAKDVSGCAYVATIGDTGQVAPSPGQITVSGDVDGSNPNDVQVQTFDKTGTAADSAFHLYVSCP
jgi:hypothetical protein